MISWNCSSSLGPAIPSTAIAASSTKAVLISIERATWPDERRIFGRLDALGALVDAHGVKSPALLVIGEVAAEARAGEGWEALIAAAQGVAPEVEAPCQPM